MKQVRNSMLWFRSYMRQFWWCGIILFFWFLRIMRLRELELPWKAEACLAFFILMFCDRMACRWMQEKINEEGEKVRLHCLKALEKKKRRKW